MQRNNVIYIRSCKGKCEEWTTLQVLFGISQLELPAKVHQTILCITHLVLLMEEILHHLGCIKSCKSWDKLHINWCRISSINSTTPRFHRPIVSLKYSRKIIWGVTKHSQSVMGVISIKTTGGLPMNLSKLSQPPRNRGHADGSEIGSYLRADHLCHAKGSTTQRAAGNTIDKPAGRWSWGTCCWIWGD